MGIPGSGYILKAGLKEMVTDRIGVQSFFKGGPMTAALSSLRTDITSLFERRSFLSSLVILSALLLITGCGGGSGGGGTATAIKGQAIDAPISNATITITLNAPLGQTGVQTLGTTTADGNGNFTINVAFPNSSAPVFANAQAGTTLLSSYLGPASSLAALSTLTTSNVPNLVISQVTTAALAILAATNSLGNLTPSSYASLLSQHRSDILDAAAGIMSVLDTGCQLPSGDSDTFEMAESMVTNTTATSSGNSGTSTLTNVSTTLGSSCSTATLQNLLQAISASQLWAPELDLGDVVENISPVVPTGTYTLQGLLADTGIPAQTPASSPSSVSAPTLLNDATVSASSSGAITSTSGNVSGQVYGNFVTLTLTTGGQTYSFSGKAGILPSGFLSGTTNEGFSVRTGGALSGGGGDMMKLDAVLVPRNAAPDWTGISGTSEDGTGCLSGIGFRIHGLGPTVGGYMYNVCGSAGSSPVLSLSNGTNGEDDFHSSQSTTFPPTSMNEASSGSTTYAFILQSTTSTIALGGSTGTLYYVMGSNEMIYDTSSNDITTFLMNENPLDNLAESSNGNSDH
jgi:hypothetical protein